MKANPTPYPVSSFVYDANMGLYDFHDPLQRREGQWNLKQKSELIESLLIEDPFGAVYLSMEERKERCELRMSTEEGLEAISDEFNGATETQTIKVIVDGIQRLSTIADYVNGLFALSKSAAPIGGIEVAGLKFDELPRKFREIINKQQINEVQLFNCTDADKRRIFVRVNSGKPLTKSQMNTAVASYELASDIQKILNETGEEDSEGFWKKVITKGLVKNGEDKDLILETMMLLSDWGNVNPDFSFTNSEIQDFIQYIDSPENKGKRKDYLSEIKESSKALGDFLGDDTRYIKKLTIPMMVAGYAKVVKQKKKNGKEIYLENVKAFIEYFKLGRLNKERKTDSEEVVINKHAILHLIDVDPRYELAREYLPYYNTSGTASARNVSGRWNIFKQMLKEYPADASAEVKQVLDKIAEEKAEKAIPKKRGRKPKAVTQEDTASELGQPVEADIDQEAYGDNESENELSQQEGESGGTE